MMASKFSVKTLADVQQLAAGIFLIFLIVHLANTMIAVFGLNSYNGFQVMAQTVYQYPLVEIGMVFLPLTIHALFGSAFVMAKFGWNNGANIMRQARRPWVFSGLSLIAAAALLAFGGQVYDIPNPVDNDFVRAYSDLFGIDL